jgi:CHASE3 domain sensor protein
MAKIISQRVQDNRAKCLMMDIDDELEDIEKAFNSFPN